MNLKKTLLYSFILLCIQQSKIYSCWDFKSTRVKTNQIAPTLSAKEKRQESDKRDSIARARWDDQSAKNNAARLTQRQNGLSRKENP